MGLVVGATLALLSARAARALLFGIAPQDPSTLAAACLLLSATVLAASTLPARRAIRLDPLTTLREE
jgi:putative ABC transport system permease protein